MGNGMHLSTDTNVPPSLLLPARYLVRTIGSIAATMLVGFGMNGKEYNGTFDFSFR